MKNLILKKFDLVQIATDEGLLREVGMNQKYENKLEVVEKQFGRIMTGLQRIDKAETTGDYKFLRGRILDVISEDLPDAMHDFMESYLDALYEAIKDALEEDDE